VDVLVQRLKLEGDEQQFGSASVGYVIVVTCGRLDHGATTGGGNKNASNKPLSWFGIQRN